MEILVLILLGASCWFVWRVWTFKIGFAAHMRAAEELQALTRMIDQYQLIDIEQVQDTWLVYDSVSHDFLVQCSDLQAIADHAAQTWPDKAVLVRDITSREIYVANLPPDWPRTDEGVMLTHIIK